MSRGKRKIFCLIGVTVTDISFVYSSFGSILFRKNNLEIIR